MNRIKLASFLLLAMAPGLIFVRSARADLQDGLVSYWPLDGNFADVVGQNDGELLGSDDTAVFEPGKFDSGIVLDGIDQFIEIGGDESEFDFVDQDFSISAWFRVDAFTKSWQALIAKGEGNRWRVHRRGGESIMTWNGGNADVPAYVPEDFDLEPADDGEIHHFVGVSTADEVLMYIDGELVSIGPAPSVENNDMPVMIGENPDARNRTWEGLIDDVAIWGRALDDGEVALLWNDSNGNRPIDDVGPVPPIFIGGENTIGSRSYVGDQSNEMLGPEQPGTPGWSGRIVTFEDTEGITIGDHTTAQDMLDEFEGTKALGAYPVVDMAGGGGTFPENLPYPNGVTDTSQSDFVVEVTAEVTIPAGTWTIAFGSDDGGRVQIPGVEFDQSQNNDSFDDDEIRFEGNRGHGWTVGSFELAEELTTTIEGSFHERGGGDSFEIAVIEDEVIENASPAGGWELLGDGTLGWSVTTTSRPLLSADLTAEVKASRPMQFDVNGDSGEADQLVMENPDPSVFTTIMDVSNDLTFDIKSAGTVTSGEAFTIIDADRVVGTPTITSVDPAQNWVFDEATGRVCLDSCPTVGGGGDYNMDGAVDVLDINLQSAAMKDANPDLSTFDENGDGVVNFDDRKIWVETHKNTYLGDANLDGEFNSGDLVTVFTAGEYETGNMAGWAEGDWDGNMLFGSGDIVQAFQGGGFEIGPRQGAAAVPEPSSLVLALLSVMGLAGVARRRNG